MNRETGKEKVNQDFSRREFIKTASLTVGAASALSVCGLPLAQAAEKSQLQNVKFGRGNQCQDRSRLRNARFYPSACKQSKVDGIE